MQPNANDSITGGFNVLTGIIGGEYDKEAMDNNTDFTRVNAE